VLAEATPLERYQEYARWFLPKVAIKMLTQVKGVIDVVKLLKSEYLNHAHTLFVAVCDTMLLHKTLKNTGQ
jgi:hypothetical protein